MQGMFPLVREAVSRIIPVESLKFIGYSHSEADECGSMAEWLARPTTKSVLECKVQTSTEALNVHVEGLNAIRYSHWQAETCHGMQVCT